MTKKADESNEPEAAPSADPTENEEEQKTEGGKQKAESKPAPTLPVIEQVENHETVPAWFKPFGDQLSAIAESLKSKAEPQPKSEPKPQPQPEAQNGEKRPAPKKSNKVRLWRTF